MKFTTIAIGLETLASAMISANAFGIPPPHIISPHAGAIWKVGSNQTVVWETLLLDPVLADIPAPMFLKRPDALPVILNVFLIGAGLGSVIVPPVANASDYKVSLADGSSANFTIY